MEYIIEPTKTNAGTRKLPMTEEVFRCFQAILEDREPPAVEPMVDGYVGFLYLDDQGLPLVAMHWEHRFNRMVRRYNDIFRVQMPNITPHVCRHTYCSNQGYDERIHAPGSGGCSCGDGQDEGGRRSTAGAGEGLREDRIE